MDMYLITEEGIDDGMWYDEPHAIDTEREAREAILDPPPEGYCHVLYRCEHIAVLSKIPGEA